MPQRTELPIPDRAGFPADPLRVCFVTQEYLGFPQCGGIGTAVTNWARALAGAGHHVSVLFTGEAGQAGRQTWSPPLSGEPEILFLPQTNRYCTGSRLVTVAHRVFSHLGSLSHDVVHFHDWLGQGYYCFLAKRQKLAFENTLLCTTAHGPTPWVNEANRQIPQSSGCIEAEFMERKCVELADALLSPSRFMLSWMEAYGWRLPSTSRLMPYHDGLPAPPAPPDEPRPPREAAFFGRLETRKGVALFCDAMDILAAWGCCPETVTFLGSAAQVEGIDARDYLRRRAGHWPCAWRHLGSLSRDEAIRRMRESSCLAVIPSLCDNSPNTVHECLAAAIPFIAADTGGIPEIIAQEDRDRVLFAPRPLALAEKLREALSLGASPARPALAPDEARSLWLGWHDRLASERHWKRPRPDASGEGPPPKVSVCLTHHDRPQTLLKAVESLRNQDYPDYEVILVDDGSEEPGAHAALDALETDFASRGWTLVRGENRYLGAARNACAALADGEYLLFMDDDNLAKPEEISTFVRAARACGADILTCVAEFFEDTGPRGEETVRQLGYYVPLGGSPGSGFLSNAFGDANALVKASVFKELGGFTRDRDTGFEDWEFFAKAVLAGYDLQVVPYPLFSYRSNPSGMLGTTHPDVNLRRAMRPFLDRFPTELAQAMLLCQSAPRKLQAAQNEIWALRQTLERGQPVRPAAASPDGADALAPPPESSALLGLGRLLRRSPLGKAVQRLRRDADARLLRQSPLFDARWYLAAFPDVAQAGADPVIHYLAHGAAEGRNPHPCFDTRFYLESNRDVAQAGMNPLAHYIRHGLAEGRAAMPRPHATPSTRTPPAPSRSLATPVICPASDWAVSGVHTAVEQLGAGLRARGWDCRILFTRSREEILAASGGRLPDLPHEFLPLGGLDGPEYNRALGEFFSRRTPCVFLCGCDFQANRAAAWMPEGVGVIVHTHSDEEAYYEQSALLAACCKANICVSGAVEENVRRLRGLEGKTLHIPNAGLRQGEVRVRQAMAGPDGGLEELRLAYTGRLVHRQKRVLDFIPLVRALEDSGRPYRLSLIGQDLDGAEAVLRRELAGPIGRGRVRLPGRLGREELLQELDGHDFFVLLSEYEGFSVSLAEAMGRGCVPLVAATRSGNREIVRPGHNGMVMDHRDYRRWARWLLDVSADGERWLKLSRAASETVLSSFTIEIQARRVDELLRAWWTPESR